MNVASYVGCVDRESMSLLGLEQVISGSWRINLYTCTFRVCWRENLETVKHLTAGSICDLKEK